LRGGRGGRHLVPVIGLLRLGVVHLGIVDPVLGLRVGRIVDDLLGVDRRLEVRLGEERGRLDLLVVHEQLDAVVRADDGGVQVGQPVAHLGRRRADEVLLLPFA
jgi:hypothetical protein